MIVFFETYIICLKIFSFASIKPSTLGSSGIYEDKIEDSIKQIKEGISVEQHVDIITDLLKQWDEYSQPLQLIYQHKGLDEKRAKEFYFKLRDVYLLLANKNENYQLSLRFASELNKVFPELSSVASLLKNDIQDLENLIKFAEAKKDFEILIIKITDANEDSKKLSKSIMSGNFAPNGRGVAGALYKEFEKAVVISKDKEYASMPWELIYKLALIMNNKFEEPEAAYKILVTLQSSVPLQDPPVINELDINAIQKNIASNKLHASFDNQSITGALLAIDELLVLTQDEDEKKELLEVKMMILKKQEDLFYGNVKKFVFYAFVIGFFLLIGYFDK